MATKSKPKPDTAADALDAAAPATTDDVFDPKIFSQKRKWESRAVVRLIEPGNNAYCAKCDDLLKFRARLRLEQVICNVYVKNKWDRVEHYHPECYEKDGSPYGQPARTGR